MYDPTTDKCDLTVARFLEDVPPSTLMRLPQRGRREAYVHWLKQETSRAVAHVKTISAKDFAELLTKVEFADRIGGEVVSRPYEEDPS